MRTNVKSFLLALCALALCGTASARAAAFSSAQSEMKEAIVKLEMARHARSSMEALEAAKRFLGKAKHKGATEAVEAIKKVDKAIEASRQNNQKAMQSHIDAAVRDIRSSLKVSGS